MFDYELSKHGNKWWIRLGTVDLLDVKQKESLSLISRLGLREQKQLRLDLLSLTTHAATQDIHPQVPQYNTPEDSASSNGNNTVPGPPLTPTHDNPSDPPSTPNHENADNNNTYRTSTFGLEPWWI